ncbi:MAG: MFS transporter, partial [Phycisphaerae bacterium]|nr:MFS transporter [Phycisphaerae bacterium]
MSASPSQLDQPPPLWRNVSFHLLWTSTFFSGVGDRMIMNAALGMLGYPIGDAIEAGAASEVASIQAGIQFFFFLPYLLWSPMAGWLTDRLPRKWILFTADELRGLIVLAAVALLPAGVEVVAEEHRWMVLGVILLVGVMAATFVPAKLSIVPNVVGWEMLTRANAAVVSMGIIGNLIGFIVGGLMVEHSLRAMILTSSGCYLVSGLFWLFLKTPWKKRPREKVLRVDHPVRDIRQGLRYALHHRPIRMLILTLALIWTGVAVYMPALAVVNVELYGQGAKGLMYVMAPVGLGMLLAAVVVGVLNPRVGNELLIALGLLLCAVFIGLQMIVPSFGLGVAIALGTGIGAGLILVPLNTMLQRCSADHVRGRVFAAKEVVQELGQVVVSCVIWQAGAAANPAMRPITGAYALLLIVAAVWGFRRYVLVGPMATGLQNFLWRFCRLYCQTVHRLVVV